MDSSAASPRGRPIGDGEPASRRRPSVDGRPVATGRVCVNRFTVAFEYPVHFTEGVLDTGNPLLRDCLAGQTAQRPQRLFGLIDAGVAAAMPDLAGRLLAYVDHFGRDLALAAPPMTIPGGEACKNDPRLVWTVIEALQRARIDRHACVVAIGGGAVLDLAGFAAAITHRGIRLIRLPTTVLAQNDAGIGVKNAINAFGCKNFIGTFAPPVAVLNDLDFIATLDRRDRIAGIAEAVKVALIRDPAFFRWLEAHVAALAAGERPAMATMIRRCAELHLAHIAGCGDPFEQGNARPLDYGHWAAHKLEALTGHDIRHGEAVAIGVALDTRYAAATGLLDEGVAERVCALLEAIGFRLWHERLAARDAAGRLLLLDGLEEFREHLGGELTLAMLTGIGHAVDLHAIDQTAVAAAIDWLQRRDHERRDHERRGHERRDWQRCG